MGDYSLQLNIQANFVMAKELVKNKQNSNLYGPTVFWADACQKLTREIKIFGLTDFRRLETPLHFFVPSYGYFNQRQLAVSVTEMLNKNDATNKQKSEFIHFLSGEQAALSDYRTLIAANVNYGKNLFEDFSESTVGNPVEQFEFDKKKYSRSSLNYLLGLSFLRKYTDFKDIKVVMEIGGGFGTLGEITRKCLSDTKYIDLDIEPVSNIAQYYLCKTFQNKNITRAEYFNNNKEIIIKELDLTTILPTSKIENIKGSVDLFVNFISFQEMEPDIAKNYLDQVDRLSTNWILLRNLREGKPKASSSNLGVITPIRSDDYINMLPNYNLVDRNVIPFGYKTVDGFHSELMLFRRNS